MILVGFGGVQAEILQDVRLLAARPARDAIVAELRKLEERRAARRLARLAGARRRCGGRASSPRLGRLLRGTPAIREIDLNPVVVYPKGQGAVALDALILAE